MYYLDNTRGEISLSFFREICASIGITPIYEREQDIDHGLFLIDETKNSIAQIWFDQNKDGYNKVREMLAQLDVANLIITYLISKMDCDNIEEGKELAFLNEKYLELSKYFVDYPNGKFYYITPTRFKEAPWCVNCDARPEHFFKFQDAPNCSRFYQRFEKTFSKILL